MASRQETGEPGTQVDLLRVMGSQGPLYVVVVCTAHPQGAHASPEEYLVTESEAWAIFRGEDRQIIEGLPPKTRKALGLRL